GVRVANRKKVRWQSTATHESGGLSPFRGHRSALSAWTDYIRRDALEKPRKVDRRLTLAQLATVYFRLSCARPSVTDFLLHCTSGAKISGRPATIHDGAWQRIHDTPRDKVRRQAGRKTSRSAAVLDSQTVKTTDVGGSRRFDAGQEINGRKRLPPLEWICI